MIDRCYLSLWGHEKIDVLQNVEEELVAPVLDTLASPPDLPGYLEPTTKVI